MAMIAMATPTTEPTMTPINAPLARPDEDEEEEAEAVGEGEGDDVPVMLAADKGEECEDVGVDVTLMIAADGDKDEAEDVKAVVGERKSEELRQSNWQPYSTRQLLKMCWPCDR